MMSDGVCCCLHVMYIIHCKKNFFNTWGQYLVKVRWSYLPALSCYVQKYVLYLPIVMNCEVCCCLNAKCSVYKHFYMNMSAYLAIKALSVCEVSHYGV